MSASTRLHNSLVYRWAVLLVWVIALIVFADPGTFNIDEIHYLLAAQRFAAEATFTIPNGLGSFPHDLLLFMHPQPLDGLPSQEELTSFIPPLYIFPAAIAYSIGGIIGLFAINALAFIVSVVLAMRLASLMSPPEHREVATWLTLVAFLGGTYFSGYVIAIVNHSLTLVLVLGAISVHPLIQGDNARRGLLLTLLSGLLMGFAFGIRLQQVVTLVLLCLFCLTSTRRPFAHLILFTLGAIPPIAAVAWINHLRFGSMNPLSYGVSAQASLVPLLGSVASNPVLLLFGTAIGAVVVLLAAWNHENITTFLKSRLEGISRQTLVLSAASIPLLFLLIPPFGGHFAERVVGLFPIPDPDSDWSDAGLPFVAVWSGVRTPLLASAPLVLCGLLMPFLADVAALNRRVWLLWAVAWANILFVCLLTNNGGYFMNQRYMLEAAAFALILVAVMAAPVVALVPSRAWLAGGGFLVFAVFSLLFLGTVGRTLGSPSTALDLLVGRFVPALAAFMIVLGFALHMNAKPLGAVILGFALPYCFLVPAVHHAWYDLAHEHEYRRTRREAAEALAPHIPDGSLLIVYGGQREPAGRLKEATDVWVADALRTEWAGVIELIDGARRNEWRKSIFLIPTGVTEEVGVWLRANANLRHVADHPFPLFEVTDGNAGEAVSR